MKTIAYLAPKSPARHCYSGKPYLCGDSPEPIVATHTSSIPGFVHVDMADGTYLTVEHSKGYLLSVEYVTGQRPSL